MLLSTGQSLTPDDLDSLTYATDSEIEELLMALPMPDREAILEALIERAGPPEQAEDVPALSLLEFGRQAWEVLRPGETFVEGQHIRAICAHLEYATDTPDYDLLITMPPNFGKSMWATVIWPAWVWGPRAWPSARFLFTSYSADRAKDDAGKCKRLIESAWYQERWGIGEDEKPKTENPVIIDSDSVMALSLTAGGQRKAAGTGGLGTGEHPHFLVCDDANKATDTAADFRAAISWWTGQMSTRGILRGIGSRRVVLGQRLELMDVPQACIDLGYDHVCLPMWAFEPTLDAVGNPLPAIPTKLPRSIAERYGMVDGEIEWLGWLDPRKPGELLWPEMVPEEKARSVEKILGPIKAPAQLQQRPVRTVDGGLFPRSRISWMEPASIPWSEIDKIVRYWDKAGGTSAAADRSAGVLIGRWRQKNPGGGYSGEVKYIVLDVVSGRWNPFERNTIIEQTAEIDRRRSGLIELWIEKEARGGAGIESAAINARDLAKFGVRFDEPKTSKLIRARNWSSAWHAGNVILVVGAWNAHYLSIMEAFTGEDKPDVHDDEVDASSGAGNIVIAAPISTGGFPTGVKAKSGLAS